MRKNINLDINPVSEFDPTEKRTLKECVQYDSFKQVNPEVRIAYEVTSILKYNGFQCFVAGGAPRDWYFGHMSTDIDVYVSYNYYNKDPKIACAEAFNSMSKIFATNDVINDSVISNENTKEEDDDGTIYFTSKYVVGVSKINFLGKCINFIFIDKDRMENPIDDVVLKFSSDSAMFVYDGRYDVIYAGELVSESVNDISVDTWPKFIHDNNVSFTNGCNPAYAEKIKTKFMTFSNCSFTYQENEKSDDTLSLSELLNKHEFEF